MQIELETSPGNYVICEGKKALLPWQERGLGQTASGYGTKLVTPYMVRFNGKWRRIYACHIGNAATLYIGKPGAWDAVVFDMHKSETT